MDLTTRIGKKVQGRRIQRAAEAVNLSLEDLAREIGCSRALIYQYAAGGVLAQPGRLQKIAQRTGRPLTYFYQDETEEEMAAVLSAGRSRGQSLAAANPPSDGDEPAREPPHAEMSDSSEPARPDGDERPATAVEGNGPARLTADDPAAPPGAADLPSPQEAAIALPYLEELADAREAWGDASGLITTCERILPFARELGNREAEARAWLRIGNARLQRGESEPSMPALRLALSLFESLGNERLCLSCRQSAGRALLSLGQTEAAMEEFRVVAQGPHWVNRWQGLVSMAAVYEHQGDFQRAIEQCEASLEVIESDPDAPVGMVHAARCYVLSNQANVYLACGDFQNTAQLSQDLLRTAERASQRDQFVEGLIDLGVCHLYQGAWDRADESLRRAVDLSHFVGDRSRWGLARAWLALLLALLGEPENAKSEAKDALRVGMETASRRCEIQAQLSLSEAYLRSGALGEALYHVEQAREAASSNSSVLQESLALQRKGRLHLLMGDPDEAAVDAGRALRLAQTHGIQHVEAMALELMGRIKLAEAVHGSGEGASSAEKLQDALDFSVRAGEAASRLGMPDLEWRSAAVTAELMDRLLRRREALSWGAIAVQRLQSLQERIREWRDEEGLLEEPAALEAVRAQAGRLRAEGRLDDAANLVEESRWPPLTDWLETLAEDGN